VTPGCSNSEFQEGEDMECECKKIQNRSHPVGQGQGRALETR